MNIRSYKSLSWLLVAVMLFGAFPLVAGADTNGAESSDEVLYLVDDPASGPSLLFEVQLVEGPTPKALLTQITTLTGFDECQAIACHPDGPDHKIYAINKNDAKLGIYDVSSLSWTTSTTIKVDSQIVPGIVQAAFSPDGRLFIASASTNEIYVVNTDTGNATSYGKLTTGSGTIGIAGGDLAFDTDGNMYVWTNSDSLYKTTPGAIASPNGNINTEYVGGSTAFFTGLALRANGTGEIVGSQTEDVSNNKSNNAVVEISKTTGGALETYPMYLDGSPYTKYNWGDMSCGPINTYEVCGHKYEFTESTSGPGAGWEINLKTSDGATTWSAVTTTNGSYCFNDLPAGDYVLYETTQTGWEVTSPSGNEYTFTLANGEDPGPFNFYNREIEPDLYEICGYKYDYDPPGEGLAGWEINLLTESTTPDSWILFETTTTGADGKYCFVNLPAGKYKVIETTQSGWEQMEPGIDGYEVMLPSVYGIERTTASQPGGIYQIDPETGLYQFIFKPSTETPNNKTPNGLAVNSKNGYFYYTDYYNIPTYLHFAKPDGTDETTVTALKEEIACADFYGGTYYYIAGGPSGGTDDLYKIEIDPLTGMMTTKSALLSISGDESAWTFGGDIAITPEGMLYGWGRNISDGEYEFFKFDVTDFSTTSSFVSIAKGEVGFSLQLAFGPDGTLYGHDASSGNFYSVDMYTGVPTLIASCDTTFTDLASGSPREYNFYNKYIEPELYEICGTKYEITADETTPGAGWTINLEISTDSSWEVVTSTATDAYGDYCFTSLSAGTYRLTETTKTGWTLVTPSAGYYEFSLPCNEGNEFDFYNEELEKVCVATETAWAAQHLPGETRFTERGSWATYVTCSACCDVRNGNGPIRFPLYAGQHYLAGWLEIECESVTTMNARYVPNVEEEWIEHCTSNGGIEYSVEGYCGGKWELVEYHLQVADSLDGLLDNSNGENGIASQNVRGLGILKNEHSDNGKSYMTRGAGILKSNLNGKEKPMNPSPGQFDYKGFDTEWFKVDIEGLDCPIFIAAHAVMRYCGYECPNGSNGD